jgi:hypothetical protein
MPVMVDFYPIKNNSEILPKILEKYQNVEREPLQKSGGGFFFFFFWYISMSW